MSKITFSAKSVGGLFVVMISLLSLGLSPVSMASQITNRSIQLSSSSVSASDVSYDIRFTTDSSAEALVIDFCSNSPLAGQTCVAPIGFSAISALSSTSGFTDVTGSQSKVVVVGSMSANDEVAIELTGITNPSQAGAMYARIVTYDTKTDALDYTSTDLGAGYVDDGSVAISITPTIGVSGTVLESLTFCVSGSTITANCGSTTTPVLELGEQTGDIVSLTPGVISQGVIYTQISTNAVDGAVIHLKSSATGCGGLVRIGHGSSCDIKPALNTGLSDSDGTAKFGVKTAVATDTQGVNATGIFQPASGSIYNNDTFALNFVSDNSVGVTGSFGDPLLDTGNAPANNKNMALTFGVTVGNNTPAGTYTTNLSLIAIGKF